MAAAAGTVSALAAAVLYGSYSVPVKFPAVVAAEVDTLVFQLYKAIAIFASSWLVLLVVPLKFTWWGIVGACTSFASGLIVNVSVGLAGVGVVQALTSGVGIFVSYIWAAYVFREPIQDPILSIMALAIMGSGMVGIGMAASGSFNPPSTDVDDEDAVDLYLLDAEGQKVPCPSVRKNKIKNDADKKFIYGVMGAVFIGLSNGSFLVPLKYATHDVNGVEYLIAYGTGHMVLTGLAMLCYVALHLLRGQPPPALHLKVAAGPGLLTGLLFNIGNVASIYAIECLGLALGWPLVQCQVLVSGLWGVYYYHEVTGRKSAAVMLGSCGAVVVGALTLSQFGTNSQSRHRQ